MIKFLFLIFFLFIFLLIFGKFIINQLLNFKLNQTIRNDGPKTHLKKEGIPTMGGIIFIIPIFLISLFFLPLTSIPILGMLLYGVLGIYDDFKKRIIKKGKGISVFKKFFFQSIIGLILGFISWLFNSHLGKIGFSNKIFIYTNFLFYLIFFIFYFISTTNAFNLTDGLDGLLISVTIPILTAFIFISYLQRKYNLIYFLILIIVILLSFLIFNFYPAKIFMGDTGSLALGGLIAGIAIILHVELLMLIFGFIYIIETISVILQVFYFKLSKGKRLFKMAPIHHHFELSGKKEIEILFFFTIVSSTASFFACIIYWMC